MHFKDASVHSAIVPSNRQLALLWLIVIVAPDTSGLGLLTYRLSSTLNGYRWQAAATKLQTRATKNNIWCEAINDKRNQNHSRIAVESWLWPTVKSSRRSIFPKEIDISMQEHNNTCRVSWSCAARCGWFCAETQRRRSRARWTYMSALDHYRRMAGCDTATFSVR